MSKLYKSNYLLAKKFSVSATTIQNWIDKAVVGELDLQVAMEGDRWKIIDNLHNHRVLHELSDKALKHNRFRESEMKVNANQELENILGRRNLNLLIQALEDHSEIPMKLAYLGKVGASKWIEFYKATSGTTNYSATNAYDYFLDTQLGYILSKFPSKEGSQYSKINLIDLACGTAQHTLNYVKKLNDLGLLGSFAALDISKEMLEGIEQEFEKDEKLQLTHLATFQHDLDESSMPTEFMEKYVWDRDRLPNLFLNFGGQISNGEHFEQIALLANISRVMSKKDRLLVINAHHQQEDYVTIPSADYDEFYKLFGGWIIDFLGIPEEAFSYHKDYDDDNRKRSVSIRPKKDIVINFDWLEDTQIRIKEGQDLTFWKHRREDLQSITDIAEHTGMTVELFATTAGDRVACYMLKKR
jgi:SAM-dependent methyltransferase